MVCETCARLTDLIYPAANKNSPSCTFIGTEARPNIPHEAGP